MNKKNVISTLLCLLCLFLVACQRGPITNSALKNANAVLKDTNGKTYVLKNYTGKWLVLNYWASWCEPCYEEIPQLNKFYQHFGNRVLLFGVSYDHLGSVELTQVISKMQISYPVLNNDPGTIFGIDDIAGLPATFIINPQGKVVKALYGKQTEQSLIQAMNLQNKVI